MVFVEHGGSGGRVAWPIAQEILEGYFVKIKGMKRPEAPGVTPAGGKVLKR